MHPKSIEGQIDRLYIRESERTLFLKMTDSEVVHVLRMSADAPFRLSVELTKPGDEVLLVERNGHLEKFQNRTVGGSLISNGFN